MLLEGSYLKIRGWLFEPEIKSGAPQLVLNEKKVPAGYILTGKERMDVARAVSATAQFSGFLGYIDRELLSESKLVYVKTGENLCSLLVESSIYPFSILKPDWENVTVTTKNVVNNKGWFGSDFHRTEQNGFSILGSYLSSDADQGSIVLTIKQGDKLMYRTGPDRSGQVISIIGTNFQNIPLPLALDWRLIEFDGLGATASNVQVVFKDDGSGWGQWSAISVVEDVD
jgi:hypothetical protein